MPAIINVTDVKNYTKNLEILLKNNPNLGESNTRRKLIDPLIELLGWNIRSEEVDSEYTVDIGTSSPKVDYALLLNGKPIAFIEAKSLVSELDEKSSTQTISYGKAEDVRWVALTNGKLLKIFDTTKSGKSEKDNLICEINLSGALNYLDELALLHKESLSAGETERIADRFFQRRLAISRMRGGKNKLFEQITNLITGIIGDSYKEQAKEVASQLALQATELIEKSLLSKAPAGSVTPPPVPERYNLRKQFWKQLLEYSRNKTQLFSKISPSNESWISKGAGKSGLAYGYIILMNSALIELYIDTGEANKNKKIFVHCGLSGKTYRSNRA